MLQSIQYGSGPPTYVYSNNTAGTSSAFFHVYASEMSGYDSKRDNPNVKATQRKQEKSKEKRDEYIHECFEKEYKEINYTRWK